MGIRIPFDEVKRTVKAVFLNAGMSEEDAELCAMVHTSSSADGVESHGLNRIPRFVSYIRKGIVDVNARPELIGQRGAAKHYDGHLGSGVNNAMYCANEAVELAKEHGIGMVALRNTNHWMRGGTYAWEMAKKGFIAITFINTESCMPLWGSDECSIGNNPFCMAIPRDNGDVVVDMAMSQYAYGKLGVYRLAGKDLPYEGGFDKEGNLTKNPEKIEESMRILPTGMWKGSALALAIDLAAAMLSNGRTGADMTSEKKGSCVGCSQIFIAIDPYLFGDHDELQKKLDERIDILHRAHTISENDAVRYPGEATLQRRNESIKKGVMVDETIWNTILALEKGDFDNVHIE